MQKILSPLAALIIIAAVTSCSLWTENREWETVIRDEEYGITPATLLENIKDGKGSPFTLLTATPPVYPPRSNIPVQWEQADYISIAKAFYHFVWQDPLPEGDFVDIAFHLYCNEIGFGPQSTKYKLINIVKSKDDETRIDRTMIIDAYSSRAYAWENSFNPNYSHYKFIDLSKIKIPVELALSVAEENGGEKFRLEHEDRCAISANLNPNGYYDGWVIEYSLPMSENVKERFRLQINTITGEFQEIR